MKTNNNYLRTMANKLGAETMINRTNNYYLKKIFEKLGGTTDYHKSDNQYLKYISENISGGTCDIEINWELTGTVAQRITKIRVSEGVTSIPNNFFSSFKNLEEFSIPSTVTGIGTVIINTTFQENLEKIYLNWTENPVEYSDTKFKVFNDAKFIIPKGTTEIYENANYPSDKLVEREE